MSKLLMLLSIVMLNGPVKTPPPNFFLLFGGAKLSPGTLSHGLVEKPNSTAKIAIKKNAKDTI